MFTPFVTEATCPARLFFCPPFGRHFIGRWPRQLFCRTESREKVVVGDSFSMLDVDGKTARWRFRTESDLRGNSTLTTFSSLAPSETPDLEKQSAFVLIRSIQKGEDRTDGRHARTTDWHDLSFIRQLPPA